MIKELERFIKTVEENSFTKAAQKLYLTQPALSLSIQRLEEEIGTKLFKRTGKRLVLTKDGEFIYALGLQIIKLWEKIKDPKRKMTKGKTYSIGIFDNAALQLSKYLQSNLSKDPLMFEITIDRTSDLVKGMINGLFDICICVIKEDYKYPQGMSLVYKFSEELVPVSSKIWKKKISEIPLIFYNKGSATREYIDKIFIKKDIKPNVLVESTSPTFMKELAIGGYGVSLLPKNFIQRELDNKKLFIKRLPFKFEREIGVFLNQDSNIKKEDKIIKEIIKNLE